MIEEPRHLDIIHVFDVGVDSVSIIDRHPDSAGPHDTEHAEQHAGIVVGINSCGLFASQTTRAHGASNTNGDIAGFAIVYAQVAIDDGGAVGIRVCTFIEIVDGPHNARSSAVNRAWPWPGRDFQGCAIARDDQRLRGQMRKPTLRGGPQTRLCAAKAWISPVCL